MKLGLLLFVGGLPDENSWAKARDISSKGKPTVTNLTILSRGSSRRSPLSREPLRSGSRASESMYSAAVCASVMMLPRMGALGGYRENSILSNPGTVGQQLQAASFQRTPLSQHQPHISVLGPGNGSLHNCSGSEPDTLAIRGKHSLGGSSLEEGQAFCVAGARLLA